VSGQVTGGLRALLGRLVSYRVNFEDDSYDNANDHIEADLTTADVISSQLKVGLAAKAAKYRLVGDGFDLEPILDLHQIVIDVDHPVHVVESSTPGHHHLYVEIPPVPTEDYFEWLEASAKIGLVEPGYVSAFKARGFSCVRLPWVSKLLGNLGQFQDEPVSIPDPFDEVVPPIFPGV
jgi:hypothetical protein